MNIDTLILSGGGPSGYAYFGIWKALFDHNIITPDLDGIQEIITTSIGILSSFFLILRIPLNVSMEIAKGYDLDLFLNKENIKIDDILVDHGIFETNGIYNLMKSILKNSKDREDITLKELYELTPIKLTVKVFNVTKKQLEYISHETYPDLSVLILAQMTTAIPLFFKPVKYNENLYVDGGLRGHFPIEACKSKNYLGLFIGGGTFPKDSEIIKLFPILEFLYSLMINQDQVVYDIKENKGKDNIIYVEINYGLNFDMSLEDKERLINSGYKLTIEHIKKHLVKDTV